METTKFAEQKLLLLQKIMAIENEKILNGLFLIVEKFISLKKEKSLPDIENIDIETLTFEEWNELFMEDKDLNLYLQEYDMTLGEYRKKIYNAEKSKSYPISEFFKKLENYV
ncbi:MAG: hypothetical protein JW922_07000 [Paludibacteraceae bacterium]|nr:hypothetical protein [Paludibacteraceae bacterium]